MKNINSRRVPLVLSTERKKKGKNKNENKCKNGKAVIIISFT